MNARATDDQVTHVPCICHDARMANQRRVAKRRQTCIAFVRLALVRQVLSLNITMHFFFSGGDGDDSQGNVPLFNKYQRQRRDDVNHSFIVASEDDWDKIFDILASAVVMRMPVIIQGPPSTGKTMGLQVGTVR